MNYQLTENEAWTFVLMTLVYQPIVKNKTGAVLINTLLGQVPEIERPHIRQGIRALADLNFFSIDDGVVHITNRSEGAFQFLGEMSNGSKAEIDKILAENPAINKFIKDINNEIRLHPPVWTSENGGIQKKEVSVSTEKSALSPLAKVGYTILVIWILLGLFKLITTRL